MNRLEIVLNIVVVELWHNEEKTRYFFGELYYRIILYWDLNEVVQVGCCLFQVYILTAQLSEFKLPW